MFELYDVPGNIFKTSSYIIIPLRRASKKQNSLFLYENREKNGLFIEFRFNKVRDVRIAICSRRLPVSLTKCGNFYLMKIMIIYKMKRKIFIKNENYWVLMFENCRVFCILCCVLLSLTNHNHIEIYIFLWLINGFVEN